MNSNQVPNNLYFRSDQSFYPYVVTFFASLAGLQAFVDPRNPMGIRPNQRLPFDGQVHTRFSISTYDLFQQFQSGALDSPFVTARLCCMLTNSCYESVKDRRSGCPEFQFFRHIRNASSHGNRFFFTANEPRRDAEWRSKNIALDPKGQAHPLHNSRCFFDFLGPADLVLLLWDIEQLLQLMRGRIPGTQY
jgi:hypothetical protein